MGPREKRGFDRCSLTTATPNQPHSRHLSPHRRPLRAGRRRLRRLPRPLPRRHRGPAPVRGGDGGHAHCGRALRPPGRPPLLRRRIRAGWLSHRLGRPRGQRGGAGGRAGGGGGAGDRGGSGECDGTRLKNRRCFCFRFFFRFTPATFFSTAFHPFLKHPHLFFPPCPSPCAPPSASAAPPPAPPRARSRRTTRSR